MKKIILFVLIMTLTSPILTAQQADTSRKFTLVIHGGAGTILKSQMTPEREKAYRDKLMEALNKGYEILSNGGTSLDAVEAVVKILEDSPLFNAGKGAVFTNEGKNEMDAAIMDGKTMKAGAVGGVTTIKNPITAARAVMEKSPHVMLMGKGAEKFAKEKGITMVDTSYFFDQYRWNQLQKIKNQEKQQLDHSDSAGFVPDVPGPDDKKFGTVGAVAVDKHGNLAAATSTGGMTNKRFGRIGDTPIIGAGNYANNKTCAVSGTGHGEFFIRNVVAYDISALMEYKGMSLQEAAEYVVMKKLKEQGGEGGVIAVDAKGNYAMPFNTAGMYRGVVKEGGKPVVLIYKE